MVFEDWVLLGSQIPRVQMPYPATRTGKQEFPIAAHKSRYQFRKEKLSFPFILCSWNCLLYWDDFVSPGIMEIIASCMFQGRVETGKLETLWKFIWNHWCIRKVRTNHCIWMWQQFTGTLWDFNWLENGQ